MHKQYFDNKNSARPVEAKKRSVLNQLMLGLFLLTILPLIAFIMTLPLNTIESAFDGGRRVGIRYAVLAISIIPTLALLNWYVRIKANLAIQKYPSRPLIYLGLFVIPVSAAMGVSENLIAFEYEIQQHKNELIDICRRSEETAELIPSLTVGPFRLLRINELKNGVKVLITSESERAINGIVFAPDRVNLTLEDLFDLYPKRGSYLYLHKIDENWYIVCDSYQYLKRWWT